MATTIRHPRVDPRSPLVVDIHELGRRAGAMKKLSRSIPAPASLGNEVIGVPAGSPIAVELSLESVMEGVYITGTATAATSGECVRCLDPVTDRVEAAIQELYLYEAPEANPDDDLDELPLVTGDHIDLEPTLRDAIVTALPFKPVCRADCPGLCSRCGARLDDDPTHSHDEVDPRWAALTALTAPALSAPPAPTEET